MVLAALAAFVMIVSTTQQVGSALDVQGARAYQAARAGSFTSGNREVLVDAARFLDRAEDVGRVVVGVSNGRPVYLTDVARIVDGIRETART